MRVRGALCRHCNRYEEPHGSLCEYCDKENEEVVRLYNHLLAKAPELRALSYSQVFLQLAKAYIEKPPKT